MVVGWNYCNPQKLEAFGQPAVIVLLAHQLLCICGKMKSFLEEQRQRSGGVDLQNLTLTRSLLLLFLKLPTAALIKQKYY